MFLCNFQLNAAIQIFAVVLHAFLNNLQANAHL
jgi:hypothetical protein